MMNSYVVPISNSCQNVEILIKKSRFIGYLGHADCEEQARDFLAGVRAEHRQARHVCHAFVIGHNRNIQRFSDDGEPAGTAGAPILDAIKAFKPLPDGGELSDIVVAVVRYFGGILLGTGGLVQAYSQTAAKTLAEAKYTYRTLVSVAEIHVDYADIGRLEQELRGQWRLGETRYEDSGGTLTLYYPIGEIAQLHSQVAALTSGRYQPVEVATRWENFA
uniref:YigZ family protein n=1 Tax=Vaginimicrobium propionicum TaxID=1871034 RepID=UPI0009703BB1|nr:YigZ family protein [Vaginimicrobium propionicum]